METTKGLKKRVVGLLLAIIMILQILMPTLTVFAAEGITDVQFADKNLYNKVRKELEARSDLSVLYFNDDELTMQIGTQDIIKITELNLKGSEEDNAEKIVRNLKGLEAFGALKKLDLSVNFLSSEANLGYLNDLSNLTDLDLSENCIEDVSAIPNLTNAAKEGNLNLTLTNQEISYLSIVNNVSEDVEYIEVDLPQIFDYSYSKGETITVAGEISYKYIHEEAGEVSLHIGHSGSIEETKVGNVPEVTIKVSKTLDGQEASTLGTTCTLKYIVIDGEDYEGIIFHEEGNLYNAVKEQIEAVNGIGTNVDGRKYADIISSNNKYFDTEKVMVINKIDLLHDITSLDVSNSGINYLNGIEYFVGLQDLILEHNYIQNTELLKTLMENKAEKEGELANALSTELADFNEEYSKLVSAYSKYKNSIDEKYTLEKKQADGTALTTAEQIKLNTLNVNIPEYENEIRTYEKTSIECLKIINECISIDEIIGFNNSIDELKDQIELLESSNVSDLNEDVEVETEATEATEETTTIKKLTEIKNTIKTIYTNITSQISNLSREELGYLTDEEYKAYLENRLNELSEERLKEVISAYNSESYVWKFDIKLPNASYDFEIEVGQLKRLVDEDGDGVKDTDEEYEVIEDIKPYIENYYGEVEGNNIVRNDSYKSLSINTNIATVSYAIPTSLVNQNLLVDISYKTYDEDGDYTSDAEPKTLKVPTSSIEIVLAGDENKEELIEAIVEEFTTTSTTESVIAEKLENAKLIEAIIDVLEIKDKELLNIEYYDDHEILYEIRLDLEEMTVSELRSFASVYKINLTDVEDEDVKETIVENLEGFSRNSLIYILGENVLRERYATVDNHYNKTGSELLGTLGTFAAKGSNKLIDLISDDEIKIYQKFALIDAIMKEVNEYKLGKEADGTYTQDTLDYFVTFIEKFDGFNIATTKKTDDGKDVRLSESDVKENIRSALSDEGDIDTIMSILNNLINPTTSYSHTLDTRYIISEVDDIKLYDITLDFSYEQTDDEGNTKNVSLIDRIAEELNERIENIEDFDKTETLNAAKYLLNYIETIQNKTRYLMKYLSSENINSLDENGLSSIKLKLDKIASRLTTDNMSGLPNLEVLNLANNNKLVDVSPLASLTTLKILNLANDYMIDDIANLNINSFTELEILNLCHTGLTDIEIAGLKKLRCLDLSYNYLENIDKVQIVGDINAPWHTNNLRNLIHLNLSGNSIYDIENITDKLDSLALYQDNTMKILLPFDIDRDLMLYCQDLYIDLGRVSNASKYKTIELPMIFRQIEEIQGITVYFDGDSANPDSDGKEVVIPTHKLGTFTSTAEIVGGIGAGTTYTVNYTVVDKDEAAKIPVQSIIIQEEIVLDDENSSMPDLTEDGKVTTTDVDKIVEYIGKAEFPAVADVVPDGVINEYDYKLLKEYVKEGWNSDNLTLEQRQKASEADINTDNSVDNKDLEILALHILNITSNSATSIADINADGAIDIKDANMLSKYIASKTTERRNTDVVTLSILNEYKETKQLHANIMPENATDKRVTWTSNNENFVRVDENGKLTAVGEGTTTINVASVSDTNIFKTIRVDVVKAENIVEEINIVEPKEGETGIKTDYYIGEALDLSNAKLEAKRRDGSKEIIDITSEMLEGFTTDSEGEKLVTVTYEGKQTSFTIKVTEYNEPKVDITIDNLDVKLPENVIYGQEYSVEVALKEGVKAGELTVKYKDEANNDVEKPVNAGTYKVIAEIADSIYANAATIEVGTFTIAKAELPEDQRPSIPTEYTVEKDGRLNVTVENGTINVPEGTVFDQTGTKDVTLTFVPNDTNYASIEIPVKVNVVISVKGINLDKTEITITNGADNVKLTATVMPDNATNTNVTWASSDETIVKVDNAGNITAVGIGTATITVTTKDGGKTATCKVTVREMVYEVGNGYIANISPDTEDAKFFENLNSAKTYKIVKTDKTRKTIATGDKLVDENNNEIATLVVKGDVNGDGQVDGVDATAIIYHINNKQEITDPIKQKAADINGAGIDMTDWTRVIYHYIGINGYIL